MTRPKDTVDSFIRALIEMKITPQELAYYCLLARSKEPLRAYEIRDGLKREYALSLSLSDVCDHLRVFLKKETIHVQEMREQRWRSGEIHSVPYYGITDLTRETILPAFVSCDYH